MSLSLATSPTDSVTSLSTSGATSPRNISLNALVELNDDPILVWKSKQRVRYRDEVEKLRNETISTDGGGDLIVGSQDCHAANSVRKSLQRSLLRRVPSTSALTVRYGREKVSVSDSTSTPDCYHCTTYKFVSMSHPISPLARSHTNLSAVTEGSRESRQLLMPPGNSHNHNNQQQGHSMQREDSSLTLAVPQTYQVSRRPSVLLHDILAKRPSVIFGHSSSSNGRKKSSVGKNLGSYNGTATGSLLTIHTPGGGKNFHAKQAQEKNRRQANDAISAALSATYCVLMVLLGVCLPITEVISEQIPTYIYQGFYVYLYVGSIGFVAFLYISAYRGRTLFNALKSFHEQNNNVHLKHKVTHFGSFYLRVGAIAFAIGTMVYSGLEFGQFFELNGQAGCHDAFVAITPICRMILCIVQVQFIFMNTTYLDMARHKVTARFGLMHMVATNLCEWLYVLVEETKHEIFHIKQHEEHAAEMYPGAVMQHAAGPAALTVNWTAVNSSMAMTAPELHLSKEAAHMISTLAASIANGNFTTPMPDDEFLPLGHHLSSGCSRTNIMGALVQAVSPFLFPCTIEYSLICAVILYEIWKSVKSIPDIDKTRKHSIRPTVQKPAHHFSVDCSQSHRGLFCGILIIVMTIISMIMYFVLDTQPGYKLIATQEVTLWETVMYFMCSTAIVVGMLLMRDLRYVQGSHDEHHSMELDNLLLVVAQTGVYLYSMFTILGSAFSKWDTVPDRVEGIVAEIFDLVETSLQTLFILHASHLRCKGAKQIRRKPGREIITFLLVANISIWFVNTLIKGRAVFRATHLVFYGVWGWTIITHISMPLAIFYRFHSTICLFEVWKTTYKAKVH